MYIWGPSAFSFQVCSVSGIQLSLWSKWRPYLFLVFSFPYCCLLSITPWPFTDWLQLRPWISFSWTKVRLQCKNNKGKMPVLQSSTYSLQHLESNFTWDSHLSKTSRLQFTNSFLKSPVLLCRNISHSLSTAVHIWDILVNQKFYSVCPVHW